MKTQTLVVATALLMGTSASANKGDETVTLHSIDTKTSTVYWTATKVGGSHTGTLSIANGTINTRDSKVLSASIVMDMGTIRNTDLEDEGYRAKLEGHLKSEDFFSVEKFPKSSFNITEFVSIDNAKSGAPNYTITGDLTIKGITHTVSFPGSVVITGDKVAASGTMTFDRSKWNVKYGSSSFFEGLGDHLIYDDVEMKFEINAAVPSLN